MPRATDLSPSRWKTAWIWWQRLGATLLTTLALGLAFFAVIKVLGEGAKRRDQSCKVDERKELEDVDQLRQTYKYLADLTPEQLHEPINRAVLANLVKVERDALLPDAPAYCDEPGVGLDEPKDGLELPKRPSNLPPP